MKALYKDIPTEVKEYIVMTSSMNGMMGLEMYRKCKAIEEKYPEWFPWEHKYKSIPQEVHDAYNKEKEGVQQKEKTISTPLTTTAKEDLPLGQMLFNALKEAIELENKQREMAAEQRKKDKVLWDKHYKKYGLEFRY